VRVQHREYIGDIPTGVGLGQLISLRISPNNTTLFPWLYTISRNFEQWMPMGIVFEFVSTAGNAFSGGAANLGDVNMATLYDIRAEPLNTKSEILNHFYSTSAATSQNLMHAIECSPGDTPVSPRYITHNTVAPGDARLSDLGILYILSQGSQSEYTAGQLWVTYDIVLLKPRLGSALPTPSYYNAIEIVDIQEAAKTAGMDLSRAQLDRLRTRPGPREEPVESLIEDALKLLASNPSGEEEKTPAPAPAGWIFS
jgi:hypothetical protein